MTILLLAALLLDVPKSGPAYVKVPATTARSCPKPSCAPAGDLRAGQALSLSEVQGDWGKVAVAGKDAWVLMRDLAAGAPRSVQAAKATKVLECLKPTCKALLTLPSGTAVELIDEMGDAAFVRKGDVIGYVLDRKDLAAPAAPATGPAAYVPPAEPPKYIPPAEPPQYIPPGEPPEYIPADSPPIYIPPAQPAASAKAPDPKTATVLYVRRPSIDVREGPKPSSKVVAPMPGGAKLHLKKTEGEWVSVGTSEGPAAPALGWVLRAELRHVPPLIYKVKAASLSFRPCPDAKDKKCAERTAKGIKASDAIVSIDESDDKKMLLVLLPGQKEGFGWVKAEDLEPGS